MNVVVDMGGTTTRVAVSEDGKQLQAKDRFPTPQSFDEGISQIVETSKTLSGNSPITSVVVGIPGTINRTTGQVIRVAHIPSWDGRFPMQAFQKAFTVPVTLANDAELGAIGEATFGSGRGYRIVGYLAVGTGIGGALVLDRQLVPNAFHTEPGHMLMSPDKTGQGETLAVKAWEEVAAGPWFEERFGMKPQECKDPEIWSLFAQNVGVGMINVLLLWSPEVLIIGGGLSLNGEIFLAPLRTFVKDNLRMFPAPPIVAAALGDDAGLYGGLTLLE
ncbi:MAG: hypothetical protein A2900_02400 [Candidatus Chisholmbacteria bacterium RIFCSPLOWO2_01_FULL_50_28]|uniref:ROK family protein n=1 Tax=Candidatus Chisholmbacteria bacterium RIFCSPHIGHO2_01_FULL_52_32 TaxID=1797591 RepID=A0A1G1VU18_9BACT|nr:MAG: hypothetical protein A2786_04345 [Candidatus Chisholmbacteria bacterium RIFCSPHIGHO2_01_FULL_52_32]OGY19933.1 MAG: hypothetical protein A2900_02400 [Candidatus Chisholmbacteria bacterium RIFCSPLOWO2_01_FULL_50_28]